MGHCDSSAQFGRDGELLGHQQGTAGLDSARQVLTRNRASDVHRSFAASVLLVFLYFYKIVLSPFFGGACKYHPSCSNYAREAIQIQGAARGTVLAIKRLARCRPFKPGGFDPVPSVEELSREKLRRIEVEPLR
jgi:putative membrane protein insertion efficiency factor